MRHRGAGGGGGGLTPMTPGSGSAAILVFVGPLIGDIQYFLSILRNTLRHVGNILYHVDKPHVTCR